MCLFAINVFRSRQWQLPAATLEPLLPAGVPLQVNVQFLHRKHRLGFTTHKSDPWVNFKPRCSFDSRRWWNRLLQSVRWHCALRSAAQQAADPGSSYLGLADRQTRRHALVNTVDEIFNWLDSPMLWIVVGTTNWAIKSGWYSLHAPWKMLCSLPSSKLLYAPNRLHLN